MRITIGGAEDTTANAFPPMSPAAEAHLHDTVTEDKRAAPDGIEASNDSHGDGKVLLKHASILNRDNPVAGSRVGSAQAGILISLPLVVLVLCLSLLSSLGLRSSSHHDNGLVL